MSENETPNTLQDLASRISYKGNFTFAFDDYSQFGAGIVFRISAIVDNVDYPKAKIPISLSERIRHDQISLLWTDAGYFKMFVKEKLRTLELHELDEWLKFDGERLNDPHPERKAPQWEIPAFQYPLPPALDFKNCLSGSFAGANVYDVYFDEGPAFPQELPTPKEPEKPAKRKWSDVIPKNLRARWKPNRF